MEREMVFLLDADVPEGSADDLFFDMVEVPDLKGRFPKFSVPADSAQKILDRYHRQLFGCGFHMADNITQLDSFAIISKGLSGHDRCFPREAMGALPPPPFTP